VASTPENECTGERKLRLQVVEYANEQFVAGGEWYRCTDGLLDPSQEHPPAVLLSDDGLHWTVPGIRLDSPVR